MNSKLRAHLSRPGPIVNGWLTVPSSFFAEVMAVAGWDSLTIDLQHGVQDYQSMVGSLQAIQLRGTASLVRVPSNEPGIIGKALDAGAEGVICPMINSVEDVRSFVSSCLYPPQGRRSNGPIRAGFYGGPSGYQATANEQVLPIPMIETRQAVDQLEAILDEPGVEAIYIGPSDLSLSYGGPPVMDHDNPEILRIYERILRETEARNVIPMIHTMSADYAIRAIGMGFKLVTIAFDIGLLLGAAQQAIETVRAGAAAHSAAAA